MASYTSSRHGPLGSSVPFTQISCASLNFCVLLDADGNLRFLRDGTWSPQMTPEGAGLSYTLWVVTNVTCVSSTWCMALDNHGNYLLWDGTSWSAPIAAGLDTSAIQSLSCVSAQFCVAAGGSGVTTWNGSSWSSEEVLLNNLSGASLGQVLCLSRSFCMVLASDLGYVDTFSWNGSIWSSAEPVPSSFTGPSMDSISCTRSSLCVGIGHNVAYLWNGKAWRLVKGDGLSGMGGGYVSCAPSGFCAATLGNQVIMGHLP